jgi:hypothetical protein
VQFGIGFGKQHAQFDEPRCQLQDLGREKETLSRPAYDDHRNRNYFLSQFPRAATLSITHFHGEQNKKSMEFPVATASFLWPAPN